MTAASLSEFSSSKSARIGNVISVREAETPEDMAETVEVKWQDVDEIFSDLKGGADLSKAKLLKANKSLVSRGAMVGGSGFILESEEFFQVEPEIQFNYISGRDLTQNSRNVRVIDLFDLSVKQVQECYPRTYQYLIEKVKPIRIASHNKNLREKWWIFERPRVELRSALKGLKRYIATAATAKHRVFVFLDSKTLPDDSVIAICLEDPYFLGVLSSHTHVIWVLSTGGTLEDRPRYNQSVCFSPFPFPAPTPEQEQKIRELGEKLDAHRKRVQATHADITITGMYNLLEKLRKGEAFTESDRAYNDKALVSTLKQIHDELDAAVFAAYGWQPDLGDEEILERLVALNGDRAEEERNGHIRWLRPDYQAPHEVRTQQVLAGIVAEETAIVAPVEQKPFPKQPKEQLAAIRDLLRTSGGEWSIEQIAAQFKGGGRYKGAISENLERLEWFGVLLCREDGQIKRWQLADSSTQAA